MTLLNGDHKDTKIIGTINGKNFYWKIDTGSAVTCMNINAFETAFGKTKGKNLKECQMDIFIRNRKCTHKVKIADESSENILGIDFLQKFWLHLDPRTKEITFQSAPSRALFATRNFTIPPFATTLVQARTFQNIDRQLHYIADIGAPKQPLISGLSTLVSFDHRSQCTMPIQNCAPHEVNVSTGDILGILSTEKEDPIPFDDNSLATICEQIHQRLPKVKKRAWTRKEIEERCHLGAPEPYHSQYIDLLVKHQAVISLDKYDLGLAKNFTHSIHLKDNQPIFCKQFNLPEAHTQFIEQSLDEWLKLGVVRQASSSYNSPIFCVPKKQGQGLRIVQDFRLLNQHSHIDKYSMKEISECIGDIRRANSSIFTTLDLTSRFWQMKLDPDSQPLTSFMIPNRGQFHWITSLMGLLGCPASFQRLMEQVLRGLDHILIYIDNVLIHTDTHEKHLEALEQVLLRIHQHHLKINLDKCLFGDRQVSYLGFTLTTEVIKPGEAKLKSIKQTNPPEDVKGIRSFLGLCNIFRHHIPDFAIIAAPLFKLTRQDSEYQSGPLTKAAFTAFQKLQSQLAKQPALAFPRHDWDYLLITNAYWPDQDSSGGLCATLAQRNKLGKIQIISHASRQLKENEKNYTRFLLETAAAAWGMDNFNEYLNGSKFTLYRDLTTETTLGTTQLKTLNRLRNTMIEHYFEIQDRQKADLPDFLKKRQTEEGQGGLRQNQAFNKVIHVDLINDKLHHPETSELTILSITDDTCTVSQVTVLANDKIDSTVAAIWHHWCQSYGPPDTILSSQDKVWTSKLESQINKLMPLEQKIKCRSEKDIFNQEVQQQWRQNRHDTSAEEFAQNWNFLCKLQGPDKSQSDHHRLCDINQNLDDVEDFVEEDADLAEQRCEALGREKILKRRQVSLCRHKLQGRAYPTIRKIKAIRGRTEQLPEQKYTDLDREWLQLIQMEKTIEKQKNKLLETRANDHWDPDEGSETFWEDEEGPANKQADHLENEDLKYINDILNSFSGQNCNHKNSKKLQLKSFTPEDTLTRALTPMKMPQEFNLKFNQNSTSRGPEKDNFSYFLNIEEEGPTELGDYFSDDEEATELGDYFSDNEEATELGDYFSDDEEYDTRQKESNLWSHTNFNNSEDSLPHSQPTLSEWNPVISGLDTINEARFGNDCEANQLIYIWGLSEETKLGFSQWQPFIPPEHAFQNCVAPSRWSDFSSQAYSLQEPTLTQLSANSTSTKQVSSPITPKSPFTPKGTKFQNKLTKNSKNCQTEVPEHQEPPPPLLRTKPSKPFYSPIYSVIPTSEQPFFTESSKKIRSRKFPDHQEPSKQHKLWRRPLQCSKETNHNPNTKSWNTPRVPNAGREPQASIQSQSRTYSNTTSERSTTRTRSWGTKWHKFSIRIPTYRTKSQKSTKRHQKNSRKTPLWLWSRRRYPPTCSLDTARTEKPTRKQKVSPRGENHFSKRRSESKSYNQQSESYNQYERTISKSDIKSENKDVEVRNKDKLTTFLINAKATVTAKADEVKAIGKTLKEFRVETEKQLNKKIKAESPLPPHFATTLAIFILTFNIFISIFNSFVSDPADHHFQTIGDLSDCKVLGLSRQTTSVQAKTPVNAFANPDSLRLFKVPETRPDLSYRHLHRNPLFQKHLLSGWARKSENDPYNDSFIFSYLDFSR